AGDCAMGVCTNGFCQAASCNDGVQNGDETDVNCGGSCAKCADNKVCLIASDCQSNVCTGTGTKHCATPTCSDTTKNGSETDTDCGGSCAPAKECAVNKNCSSG